MALLRRLSAGVAVLGVIGLGLLPREHVHLIGIDEEAGHHAEVIHRHFPEAGYQGSTAVDHDEAPVLWLDAVFDRVEPAAHFVPDVQLLGMQAAVAPAPEAPKVNGAAERIRGHDPPWVSAPGLRGPPSRLG